MGDCGVRPGVRSGCCSATRPGSPQARRAAAAAALRVLDARWRSRGRSGRRGGGGGGGGGWDARLGGSEPAPMGGAQPLAGSRFRHALLSPLGAQGLHEPGSRSLCHWGRVGPPLPVTSAETVRGRRKPMERAHRRTAEPARARRPRAEELAAAHALPLLYTAPSRPGAPPTGGPGSQSRLGRAGPESRRGGRRAGTKEQEGPGWGAGARRRAEGAKGGLPRPAQPPPSSWLGAHRALGGGIANT